MLTLALTGPLLTGCSKESAETAAQFRSLAAERCRTVIDARDSSKAEAGLRAALEVLLLAREGELPDVDHAAELITSLAWYRSEIERTMVELRNVVPPPSLEDAWATVLSDGERASAVLDARLDAVDSGELEQLEAVVELTAGELGGVSPEAEAALAKLGLLGRDCATVFDDHGPLAGHEEFVVAAAAACSAAIERRQANGFADDERLVREAVAASAAGDRIEVVPPLRLAVDRMAAEWRLTHQAFAEVDPATSPAPAEWQTTIDAAADRQAAYEMRASALRSGDAVEIGEAFRPGVAIDTPAMGDLAALGLSRRDCRSVSS